MKEEDPDNSYDMAEVKTQGSTVITSIANSLKVNRRIDRKSALSLVEGEITALKKGHTELANDNLKLDNRLTTVTNLNRIFIDSYLEQTTHRILNLEHKIVDEEHVSQFETVDNILRACSDIIFNSTPSEEEKKARGDEVLTDADITELKSKLKEGNYPKVHHIIRWSPKTVHNIELKAKALSCLTVTQRNVVQSVLAANLRDISKVEQNELQHRRASKTFAKEFLREVFEDEQAKKTFTEWNVKIDDLLTFIDMAGPEYYLTSDQDVVYNLKQELRLCREKIVDVNQFRMDLDH